MANYSSLSKEELIRLYEFLNILTKQINPKISDYKISLVFTAIVYLILIIIKVIDKSSMLDTLIQIRRDLSFGNISIESSIKNAEIILNNNYNDTFISESQLLEHDAVYIRLQVEKAIMKRTGKEEADYRDLSEIVWNQMKSLLNQ